MNEAPTLYDKLWEQHRVLDLEDGLTLLYVDRHLVHEVTSPQAFEGLRLAGRTPWRTGSMLAVEDHNVPTDPGLEMRDPVSARQLDALRSNCRQVGIPLYRLGDARQGIVHVVGPEQGVCLPGMSIVCGDSHTSTNGALGALAFGIGTSEVECVLATQCLPIRKAGNMLVRVEGSFSMGVGAKDLALALIGRIGTAGATRHVIEYAGSAVRGLSMESRMTLCNMSIESGARAGMVAVDNTTIDYLQGRPMAPSGERWEAAVAQWRQLVSEPGARYDRTVALNVDELEPQLTWGINPEMVVPVSAAVPDPDTVPAGPQRALMERALAYMDLTPGTPMTAIRPDKVFVGSCTNARIEDLRVVAQVVRGRRVAASIRQAMVVPGSGQVRRQAEEEGLAQVFVDAGFEWRRPGCSMCLGMNPDRLQPGERCASTSNRNFEGRQGRGGRTHLLSPAMAAAAAIAGHFTDAREFFVH